jgi:hypothetical protein
MLALSCVTNLPVTQTLILGHIYIIIIIMALQVELELPTLPEHMSSSRFLAGFLLPDLQLYVKVL